MISSLQSSCQTGLNVQIQLLTTQRADELLADVKKSDSAEDLSATLGGSILERPSRSTGPVLPRTSQTREPSTPTSPRSSVVIRERQLSPSRICPAVPAKVKFQGDRSFTPKSSAGRCGPRLCEDSSRSTPVRKSTSQTGPGCVFVSVPMGQGPLKTCLNGVFTQPRPKADTRPQGLMSVEQSLLIWSLQQPSTQDRAFTPTARMGTS